jgi:hypothetical protein
MVWADAGPLPRRLGSRRSSCSPPNPHVPCWAPRRPAHPGTRSAAGYIEERQATSPVSIASIRSAEPCVKRDHRRGVNQENLITRRSAASVEEGYAPNGFERLIARLAVPRPRAREGQDVRRMPGRAVDFWARVTPTGIERARRSTRRSGKFRLTVRADLPRGWMDSAR